MKEEKILAANAEEKAKRLLAGIEQTSAQIIVSDENGIVDYVNKKFTEVTGLTPEDIIGKDAITLYPDERKEDFVRVLSGGDVYKGEVLSRKKDGSSFWELISVSPIINNEGKITSYVAVKEDITQRKLMEQEIIDARDKAERSDKLKDAFLQNLSHEIRTPLNAVVGFSDLLCTEKDFNEEKIKEYTSIIRDSSHQLLSIVTDILTIASIQTGQETINIKSVNVNKMLDCLYEIFLPLANEKKLNLSVSYSFTGPPLLILTDETKLNQILTNLLNNAIKFTQQGTVKVKYYFEGDKINFAVEDTGIGIPKESQAFIFERFRQAEETTHIEYGGTGLGLSISGSFAHMLGGTISVESEYGKGSIFTLSLPYSPDTNQKPVEKPVQFIPTQKELVILIAEDEVNNYMLIKAFLNLPNISLLYAENGYEAVKICRSNPDIDIVLMDIKMPVMDGITALLKIRKIRTDIFVIAQTAYGMESDKMQYIEMGFDDYIAKPLKRDELIKTITRVITPKI